MYVDLLLYLDVKLTMQSLDFHAELATLKENVGSTQNELSLLDLPEIPSFDF